jgi:hypothetical protein
MGSCCKLAPEVQTNHTLAKEVELEVVEPERADPSIPADKKGRGGRPLKLNEQRFNRILELIRAGMTTTTACRVEGVTYQHWRFRIRGNSEWLQRLADAEVERDDLRRDKALEAIEAAFPKNFVAAAWLLERRYPELYALKVVNRNINSTEAPVFERVSETELVENARLAATAALNPPPGFVVSTEAASADSGSGAAA